MAKVEKKTAKKKNAKRPFFLGMSAQETRKRIKKKKSSKILSEESLEDFREKQAKRGVVRIVC